MTFDRHARPDGFPGLYAPVLSLLWPYAEQAATAFDISATLLLALCWVESGFEPDALGPDGGTGLLSMRPELARQLGLELLGMAHPKLERPQVALWLGAYYMAKLHAEFNTITQVLLAWHVGPEAVREHGPELLSMQAHSDYVRQVLLTLAWVGQAEPWHPPVPRETPSLTHAYRTLSRQLPALRPGEVR